MALTPVLTATLSEGTLTLADATVYGAPDEERTEVTVNFKLERLTSSSTTEVGLPNYDEEDVVSVATSIADGRYIATMTITITATETDLTPIQEEVFSTYRLSLCRDTARDNMACKSCHQREIKADSFMKIDIVYRVINELVTATRYSDAQCLMERIQVVCDDQDDCGC